uniref:Uncharacterized protein n=1 Tax=Sphaerodactylus townsendi TaxID=933632 RepID=A0ACB8FBU9_9SAUR
MHLCHHRILWAAIFQLCISPTWYFKGFVALQKIARHSAGRQRPGEENYNNNNKYLQGTALNISHMLSYSSFPVTPVLLYYLNVARGLLRLRPFLHIGVIPDFLGS